MGSPNNKTLTFKVARKSPELIAPAKPTPHEFKFLSDIDDQQSLRFQIPVIQFYRRDPSVKGKDQVKVIRDAIAKALVFYYPFAGRLRERAMSKLVVECTGEGVVFIEADADVALGQFGDEVYPPFPCLEELLYDVPGTSGIINCPLLLIQVTRLRCGGFVFAVRLNHTISDAAGLAQFLSAVAELARGAEAPTFLPVWRRELLSARDPPRVTCTHHEFGVVSGATFTPPANMVERGFFFSPADIAALCSTLPPHLRRRTSAFQIAVACAWRCRVIALSPDPSEEMRISCMVNCRNRFDPPLPEGYYGNAIVYPAAVAAAGRLCASPLEYAVELVQSAKSQATEEYVKSVADLMVMRGRPLFKAAGTFLVSDVTRAGFEQVDFGWGEAAYGGPAGCGIDLAPGVVSFVISFKNRKGENGIVVPMCLPENAMEIFIDELDMAMAAARKSLIIRASAL